MPRTANERPTGWGRAQRVLHWTIAALVFLTAPLGLYMVGVPFRELLLKFLLYQLHKSIGIAVFLLALVQSLLHLRRGRPAWDPALPRWQRRAAAGAHLALFLLLIATPILGYLVAATAPARIPTLFLGFIPVPHVLPTDPALYEVLRRIHLALALLLVLLALGHAFMALRHASKGRDTLRRMWRG